MYGTVKLNYTNIVTGERNNACFIDICKYNIKYETMRELKERVLLKLRSFLGEAILS